MLLEPLEEVKQNPTHPPRGRRAVPQPAGVRAGPRPRAVRRGIPAGRPAARRRQGHRPGRPRRGRACRRWKARSRERTEFLIRHHMDAQAYRDGTLGHRAKERLQASEHFDDLMLLRELDTAGRRRGAVVCTVGEALGYIRGAGGRAVPAVEAVPQPATSRRRAAGAPCRATSGTHSRRCVAQRNHMAARSSVTLRVQDIYPWAAPTTAGRAAVPRPRPPSAAGSARRSSTASWNCTAASSPSSSAAARCSKAGPAP